jgi:hypothetical protein
LLLRLRRRRRLSILNMRLLRMLLAINQILLMSIELLLLLVSIKLLL